MEFELVNLENNEKEVNVNSLSMNSEAAKAVQEIQASLWIAKQFPRSVNQSYTKIIQACRRKSLAGKAIYSFPKGKQLVEGPSIRLAEVIAQNWGNMDAGFKELVVDGKATKVQAFAWDKETNNRVVKEFVVKHEVGTKQGPKQLTDARDIYEHVASQAMRRVRACILSVIPSDIIEEAMLECNKTLAGGSSQPLQDRIRKMVSEFTTMGVTEEMLVKRIGHNLDSINETELITLGKVYNSIRDGMGKREDFFDIAKEGKLTEKLSTLIESQATTTN